MNREGESVSDWSDTGDQQHSTWYADHNNIITVLNHASQVN